MLSNGLRFTASLLTTSGLLICISACEPRLPGDLPALIQLMSENSQTLSVNAMNKVRKLYGQAGLLRALGEGEPRARARAAFRLRDFSDAEVERALLDHVANDADAEVRVQALWSLEQIGTEGALSTVERATNDKNADVARKARDAAAAIRTISRER